MRRFTIPLMLMFALACASEPASQPAPAASQPAPAPVEDGSASKSDAVAPADDGICTPGDDWGPCVDKRTRVVGRRAEFVQQHPLLTGPGGPEGGIFQGYMDADGGRQLIVLTKQPFDCPAGMTAVGVLERIDLGGEPGTKESYAGLVLRDAEVTCDGG